MKKGFTLIELLIVVAIIAILAAIAIPNFLEAQVRSKVSRSKADIRNMAVAIESYYVDYSMYCRDADSSLDLLDCGYTVYDRTNPNFNIAANGVLQLTSPIAYITSLMKDPFSEKPSIAGNGAVTYRVGSGSWSYPGWNTGTPPINTVDNQDSHRVFAASIAHAKSAYVVFGVGPDTCRCVNSYKCFPFMAKAAEGLGSVSTVEGKLGSATGATKATAACYLDYDPTNGSLSRGDIYYFGGTYLTSGRWMRNGEIIGRPIPPDSLQDSEGVIW
jgi:prepilin-type N-terminal cleavage/methylation domain-containing protein